MQVVGNKNFTTSSATSDLQSPGVELNFCELMSEKIHSIFSEIADFFRSLLSCWNQAKGISQISMNRDIDKSVEIDNDFQDEVAQLRLKLQQGEEKLLRAKKRGQDRVERRKSQLQDANNNLIKLREENLILDKQLKDLSGENADLQRRVDTLKNQMKLNEEIKQAANLLGDTHLDLKLTADVVDGAMKVGTTKPKKTFAEIKRERELKNLQNQRPPSTERNDQFQSKGSGSVTVDDLKSITLKPTSKANSPRPIDDPQRPTPNMLRSVKLKPAPKWDSPKLSVDPQRPTPDMLRNVKLKPTPRPNFDALTPSTLTEETVDEEILWEKFFMNLMDTLKDIIKDEDVAKKYLCEIGTQVQEAHDSYNDEAIESIINEGLAKAVAYVKSILPPVQIKEKEPAIDITEQELAEIGRIFTESFLPGLLDRRAAIEGKVDEEKSEWSDEG